MMQIIQKITIPQIQNFKIKLPIQNVLIQLNLKLIDDGIVFIRDNFQFLIKLEQFPQILIKSDLKIICLKLKNYTQTMNKYLSALIKRLLKVKITSIDIIFQSRSLRDYFLILLRNIKKTNSNTINGSRQQIKISNECGKDLLKNSNISAIQRNNSEKASLSLTKQKNQRTSQNTYKNDIILIKSPTTSKKNNFFSVFEQQSDILKQLESSQLFQDMKQKKQAILNLRDSFNLLQQKYMKQKIQRESLVIQQSDDPKIQLQKAKNHIYSLKQQIKTLMQQNVSLKIQITEFMNVNKQITILKKKIQSLDIENQRLQNQRAKILADKINAQMKFQKQKQQKQSIMQKYDKLASVTYLNNFQKSQMRKNDKQHHFKSPSHFLVSNNINNQSQGGQKSLSKKQLSPSGKRKMSINFNGLKRMQSYNLPNKY